MWWLNWREPPPHTLSFVCCRLLFSGDFHSSFRLPFNVCLSSSLPPSVCSWYLFLLESCPSLFLYRSHHNNFTPILSIHHLYISTLYFYVFISAFLQALPYFPAHSYAIFCYAWTLHLACGRLRSDDYISWEGVVWGIVTFSYPQRALCVLMQTFHQGKPINLGCLWGAQPSVSTPPRPQPRLAGTLTGMQRQPAQRISLFMFVLCRGRFLTALWRS